MVTGADGSKGWWGPVTVAHGSSARRQIGPLSVWLSRLQGEWRVGRLAPGASEKASPDDIVRFAIAGDDEEVVLWPALADRPVVTRPEYPFHVLPGEECTLYMTSPLWVALRSEEPARDLVELPIIRPSDTWFGPNTVVGELCYASRSFCRLRREEVLPHQDRAVTAVAVRNRARTPFVIERLKLPVQYLSLYPDADGLLWTQNVAIDREEHEMSPLALGDRPEAAGNREAVAGPRIESTGNILIRAFVSLFDSRNKGADD